MLEFVHSKAEDVWGELAELEICLSAFSDGLLEVAVALDITTAALVS